MTALLLRQALAPMLEQGTEAERANYSVLVSQGPSDLHVLYRGGCTALRTLDATRLLTAIRRHVDPRPSGARAVLVDGVAVVRGDAAVVLPPAATTFVVDNDRRMRSLGMTPLDARAIAVDVDGGELVVGDGAAVDDASAAEWQRHIPRTRIEPPVSSGRYRIEAWWFEAPAEDAPLGRAASVHHALSLVLDHPMEAGLPEALDGLLFRLRRPAARTWPRRLVHSLFEEERPR